MTKSSAEFNESVEKDWSEIFTHAPDGSRAVVREVIEAHKASMADVFYERMMQDPEARSFLDHGVVHTRLKGSMQRWLSTLFSCETQEAFHAVIAMQRHVGEVHARIDVPVNIVARGARLLKNSIGKQLAQTPLSRAELVEAVIYVDSMIDLAFEVMSAAFVSSHEGTARIDEAYRSFSTGQNMSLERERQRGALLDWELRYLQFMMTGAPCDTVPRVGQSAFGMWMQHKAAVMFRGSREMTKIRALMREIDEKLLPMSTAGLASNNLAETRRLMRETQSAAGELKFLVESLFEHVVDLESGKDALTQLLNRRFLPAILTRESEIARTEKTPFALLLVDVDHFKRINDDHGHQAGDRVLQQVAGILQSSVRSGDFVFRYGGEEFLVLLVEVDTHHAKRVAEKIRSRIGAETLMVGEATELKVTVSIGAAMHDGHPDYQRLVERADAAMYRAKQGGRNRCEYDIGQLPTPH